MREDMMEDLETAVYLPGEADRLRAEADVELERLFQAGDMLGMRRYMKNDPTYLRAEMLNMRRALWLIANHDAWPKKDWERGVREMISIAQKAIARSPV